MVTIPERLSRQQAAEYVGVSALTLSTMASRGGGPRYVKAGKRCYYLLKDLESWLETRSGCTASEIASK